ncbi:MAG: S8 family peptidase [Saprospiraceae bacterium]
MILILLYSTLMSFFHHLHGAEPAERWLVKLKGSSTACLDQWWQDSGFDQTSYVKRILPVETWVVVELPGNAIISLRKLECVSEVMPDQRIEWRNTIPNDPGYVNQVNMNLIGMPKAWDITTGGVTKRGDTIVIAVVDDGFDITHEDLIKNIWVNKDEIPGDSIDNDGNGYIDDYRGLNIVKGNDQHLKERHGTQVSGVIGARGNNNKGVSGINWAIKLMLISGADFESRVIEAYQYAIDLRKKYNDTHGREGAFIVVTNLSGGIDNAFAADHPLWCEMYDKMGAEGILSIASGPNQSVSVETAGDMPTTCTSPYLIAVTSVDASDILVDGAGFGNISIDMGAPGENILTLNLNNLYQAFGGTSAAAPHMAGAIGLLYSVPCLALLDNLDSDPDGIALKMKDYIFSTAKPNNSLESVTVTGKRLQVDAAIKAAYDECKAIVHPELKILSITPNPISLEKTRVNFISRGDSTALEYEVYTTNGDRVYTSGISAAEVVQGFFLLDTQSLAAAIYLVTLRNKKEKATAKLFVY